MKTIHKSSTAWLAVAGLFALLSQFVQAHCSVTPTDLFLLAGSVATFVSGYFKGKSEPTA